MTTFRSTCSTARRSPIRRRCTSARAVAGALHAAPNDYSRGSSTLLKSPVEALKRPAHDLRGIAEDSESLKSGLKEHMTGRDVANAALSVPGGRRAAAAAAAEARVLRHVGAGQEAAEDGAHLRHGDEECEVRLDARPPPLSSRCVTVRATRSSPSTLGRPPRRRARPPDDAAARVVDDDGLADDGGVAVRRGAAGARDGAHPIERQGAEDGALARRGRAARGRRRSASSRRTVEMQQMWREARVAGEQDVISLRRSSRAARMPMMPHKPVRQASRKPYLEKKLSDRSEPTGEHATR